MSYELKCIENKEMAMLCYEKKKYNSFVNRYYYSVYQALLDKLKSTDEDLLKDINALEGGSHEKTIYLFIEKIAKVKTSKKGINKVKEVSMIRSLFYNMKLAINLRLDNIKNYIIKEKKEIIIPDNYAIMVPKEVKEFLRRK